MAAVTQDHKLSGRKHTFILLQFWKPGVCNRSRWARVKVLEGPVPSGGPGGQSVPCLLELPESAGIPWLVVP